MEPIELTPVRDTLHLAPSIAPKIALPTLTDLTTKIPTPAELLQGVTTPQEKVEKDPYKLAEEAYFKKKKPKIDTSSSIAPTEVITPEEYKGFNKDDTISSSVKYDQNYEANKRATQTDGERWLNTAQKFGANATSMFLGGLSTIPNILGSVTNGIGYLAGQETPISEYFNMSPDSGVMKDLFEWSDSVNANNRNYQSNWSKENWIQDLVPFFGDGGFQDIVASAGYTAGAIGEAILSGGIASILSKGTKLAGMGAKLSKYLNDPAKIDKVLSAISSTKNSAASQLLGDAGYLMGKSIENSPQLYRAYVGAHVEAAFEGLEGAKRFEEDVVNEYKKNHGGVLPSEGELAKIKDLAQNVGDLRYKLNLLTLTIPNYIQMGALLKTFPGASKVAKTLLGKNELGSVQLGDELGTFKVNAVNDIKFNTTNALWDKRIPKAFKNGVEKTLSYGQKFGKIPLSISEGLEEEMQYFIDEHTTSLYKGAYLNEKGLEENSLYLSGLWDTIQNKLATKEATQAFLMGSMGGGIQQSMNTVYEAVFDKNKLKEKIAQNELYAKKLEDISGSLFKSSDVFNVATDDERAQLENYLSKALDQNSLNGTLQENYQKVLASLNTNAATNVAIQKNFLGAQRIYQDLQDRDVSGLLHSVVSSGKQEVFKEHLNSIANATEEEIQNLYGININEQTRDNKQFAKNLIDKLNKIEGYSKKISFAFNDTFDNETDNQFYSMYKQQLSHNLYMMNRKQERISDLQTANSALFLDLLQDKKQSINDKIEELKTATSLVPIKDATKRIALLEQLKDGSNMSLKDAIYAYSGESVAELEAVAEFEKANDALILKEGRSGIDNLRKYYEELYSTDGFELFKDQHKDYYDAIKAVREFQQKSADRKVRNEKQYAQLQKDLLLKDDGENIKKAVQKLSEDVSNVEDDEKLTKEQKESKKQFLINEAKQKIANLRNSKPVETVEKKTPKTETTKETEVVETPAVEVKDVVVEEIATDVAKKFSEAPLNKEEDLEDVSIDDFDEEETAAPLIDEEGNVNQGNVAPVIVDKKSDIERRRKENPSVERGVLINYESGKTKEQLIDIVSKLKEGKITFDEIYEEFFNLPINTFLEVKKAFNEGTLADKIQFGLDVNELSEVQSKTRSKEEVIKLRQKALSEKQKAETALKDSEYRIVKKKELITGKVTETKVKRTVEEKAKYEDFYRETIEDINKQIEEYDAELQSTENNTQTTVEGEQSVPTDVEAKKADIEKRRQEDSKKSPKDSVFYKLIERLSKGALTLSNLLENLGSKLKSPIKTSTGEITGISFNQGESRFSFTHKGKNLVGYFVDGKWEIGKLNEKGNYNYINSDEIQDINKKYGSQEEFLKSVNKELVNDIENFEKLKYTPEEINSNIIPLENSISNKADELRIKYGNTYLLQDFLRQYDAELLALETPVANLPFDNTNLLGAPPTENTISEVLLIEAQGLKILQPEYYLALDVLDRDEAKANFQRRKELLNSVTNLSEIPTTVREVAYPAKSINKTEQIYGDVFIKLGGGKLYHLIHTNPETGQETILYEFRSLKHGFGLQKSWVDATYPRIVEKLKTEDGLLETMDVNGFSNKQFFTDFDSYYSLYDVVSWLNDEEYADFLHKFNIRREQMDEAFDTDNVFQELVADPNTQYELNRVLDGWVDSFRGATVNSYAVDFEKQTTIDTLPQSKFIDVETGNQHHVIVYADFGLLYDEEGNLKTETEYKIAKQKVVDGMQVRVDGANDSSRISNYILDNLVQQLDSDVLAPVHFLSSGYNLVLSDTNGKPYIKSLSPSTDLKENEVLKQNLHALVESAQYNGKSTREAGFHILLNNLSKKVGYRVEVSNVKFNFYTKQDGKQVRSIAVSLEWVEKDIKKSKTLHISLKENLVEEGRYEKNIKEISDGLIKQVEKEFGVTGISAKFVAAEAKEPVDVPTILKNNNSVELGVYWNRKDFRKNTPVLFNSDRVIPRIVEEYEQELKEETSVALPVVSTKIEEAKTKTAAPIEQSDIPPIQAMVNKHVGEKGMILQKDENITSEKALLFGADIVKIMEQGKDIEQMLNEALEFSKTENENSAHEYIQSVLSYLYFDPEFITLRPYFNTQPKPIDSNCVLTQN